LFSLAIQGAGRFARLPARATLRRWVAAALERQAHLTLRFVGAREGRTLNRTYRQKDYATNVLTFEYLLPGHPDAVWADIVICVPVVEREAREQNKAARAHLAHLIVHGVLHAQGYDHMKVREAQAMEAREVELLAALGLPDPYLAADLPASPARSRDARSREGATSAARARQRRI
jgi:probable rRNA maturation factor